MFYEKKLRYKLYEYFMNNLKSLEILKYKNKHILYFLQ